MFRETEYDPVTRVKRTFEYDDDGKVHVYQTQDVSKVKERMYELRKENKYTNTGSKDVDHMNLYAELEYVHLHEAIKDGVKLDDATEMIKWVNKKHPELKSSTKWHASKKANKGTSRIIIR